MKTKSLTKNIDSMLENYRKNCFLVADSGYTTKAVDLMALTIINTKADIVALIDRVIGEDEPTPRTTIINETEIVFSGGDAKAYIRNGLRAEQRKKLKEE